MKMSYTIDPNYTDVSERMALVREKFPLASFRPANIDKPYSVEKIGELYFIIYTAAIYREPFDECPAIGIAWEQVPGLTPYTKGSELMNAETSAWGRACIAVGIPSKKIASADEVKARQPLKAVPDAPPTQEADPWTGEIINTVPTCKHGEMEWKTGHNDAKNKDWAAYQCTVPYSPGGGGEPKCGARWYVMASDGTWKPQ